MEQQVEAGYSGGRLEEVEPGSIGAVDVTSSYAVKISGDAPEPASNATEPVVLAEEGESRKQKAESPEGSGSDRELSALGFDLSASQEADGLPPVPEGVVREGGESRKQKAESPEGSGSDLEISALGFDLSAVEATEASEVQTLRFLGSSIGPELDFVSPEEGTATFGEVMIQLVDQAIESEAGSVESLTGETVAQIFCRGDVEDDRVAFLLLLLAQNEPITSEVVLAAARSRGYGDLIDGALMAREELARAGDVSVEQLSAEGWQSAEGARFKEQGSSSGSEPQAASRKPQAAAEVSP